MIKALDEATIVHLHTQWWQRQAGERLAHDLRDLNLEVERESVDVNHIDIGLQEFTVSPLLGPFPTPDLLDLITLEGKTELSGVLQDVACQRNREVEVKSNAGVSIGLIRVKPTQNIDLLVDLTLAKHLI